VVLRKLEDLESAQLHIKELEAKLERVRARRVGIPASFGVFVFLGFYMTRDEILGLPPGSAGFIWAISFVALYVIGIVWNALSLRGVEPQIREELQFYEASIRELPRSSDHSPAT
jgi:hypothetical protein